MAGVLEPSRLSSKINPTANLVFAIWQSLAYHKLEVNWQILNPNPSHREG